MSKLTMAEIPIAQLLSVLDDLRKPNMGSKVIFAQYRVFSYPDRKDPQPYMRTGDFEYLEITRKELEEEIQRRTN